MIRSDLLFSYQSFLLHKDDNERTKAGKRKSTGPKSRKGSIKSGKLDYGYERLPSDDKYIQPGPFGGE